MFKHEDNIWHDIVSDLKKKKGKELFLFLILNQFDFGVGIYNTKFHFFA